MDKSYILELTERKIHQNKSNLEQLILEARASNNDTKSSMGDKYETSREMLQQEINNLQRQLNVVLDQAALCKTLSDKSCDKVERSAVVKTDKGLFFIGVAVGEMLLDDQKIICISEGSPLAVAMKGKIIGEEFIINGLKQKILAIY